MPSPPRQFPIPEELYSNYVVTDPFEDLWPLLNQENIATEAPLEANDHVGTNSTFSPIDLQVVSVNVDPWFLRQQECGVSVPPLLLEHDDFTNINTALLIDQDIAVGRAYDHQYQANPESLILPPSDPTLLASQESARAEKGKGKLEKEPHSKWKKRGEKLKSLQIPDDYEIHQLLDDELPGTERLDQGGSIVAKKENHNAKERVRRLKLNASYLALGALLPQSRRSKKRWTAPSIIDKMVHYIPELKTEIEELINKKEELDDAVNKSSIRDKPSDEENIELDSTTVSVHQVSGGEELIIQVCMKMKQGNEEDNTFSYLVRNLEVDELLLLGASTNKVGNDRVCYNLHLQMRGSCSSSSHGSNNTAAAFKEKVLSWLRSYSTY